MSPERLKQRSPAGAVRAAARTLVAAVVVTTATFHPALTRPVAAIDCSAVYCAWLEIVPGNGTGTGDAVSVPSGIDCHWDGSRSGTCLYQFSWGHFVSGGIDVDLYLEAGPHTYICWESQCGDVERGTVVTVHLNPGNDKDVFPVFNEANWAHYEFAVGGDGGGRITTSAGGVNCRRVGGATSGSCSMDLDWLPGTNPSFSSFSFTRDPDDGSFACSRRYFCTPPDVSDTVSVQVQDAGNQKIPSEFWIAHPIAVQVTGSGSVVSNPAGITCPSTCSKWFAPTEPTKTAFRLTATPASGWFIKDWTGPCDSATGELCSFFNDHNGATIKVVFARISTPAPSVPPASVPPTPRPTATPRSSTAAPAASAGLPAPSADVPAASAPAASQPVDASIGPTFAPSPAVEGSPGPTASATGPTPSPEPSRIPAPTTSPGVGSGIEPLWLVLLGLVAACVLAIGFGAGRRRRHIENLGGHE